MTVVVNGRVISVQQARVYATLNELTRRFMIILTEDGYSLSLGDKVEFYSIGISSRLLFSGTIEKINAGGEVNTGAVEEDDRSTAIKKQVIYSGRNYASRLIKSQSSTTEQFTTGLSDFSGLSSSYVFGDIMKKVGLSINGSFSLPKTFRPILRAGDSYGKFLMHMAQLSGKIVTSDAEGNVIVLDEATSYSPISFERGKNIRDCVYEENTDTLTDKYVVLSQSLDSPDTYVKGEYGDGDTETVVIAPAFLTRDQCDKLARAEYNKAIRRSFQYSIEVDIDAPVELNSIYKVVDHEVGVDEMLVLWKITYVYGVGISKLWLGFKKIGVTV